MMLKSLKLRSNLVREDNDKRTRKKRIYLNKTRAMWPSRKEFKRIIEKRIKK